MGNPIEAGLAVLQTQLGFQSMVNSNDPVTQLNELAQMAAGFSNLINSPITAAAANANAALVTIAMMELDARNGNPPSIGAVLSLAGNVISIAAAYTMVFTPTGKAAGILAKVAAGIGAGQVLASGVSAATASNFTAAQAYVAPVRRDPLTLDLDGDGLETVGTSAGILFDHTGSGTKTGTGWVAPDDGFLVLDRSGNGVIDNGTELFGDSTLKSNGQLATDGFDALRDLDSNLDGKISSIDAQFANLRVWRDLNQDGISQSGELFTLGSLNIASINVASTANSQILANGNQIADLGSYTRTDGSTGVTGEVSGSLGDINLATDTFHRQFTDILDTTAVSALPDMQGSGAVRDLREAASQSSGLAATLAGLTPGMTRDQLKAAIPGLLQQWADSSAFTDSFEAASAINKDLFFVPPGVSALDAYNAHYHLENADGSGSVFSSTGKYDTIRAQQASIERLLKTLEAFNGRDFAPIAGSTSTITALDATTVGGTSSADAMARIPAPVMYSMEQARLDLLTQSYTALTESVYSALDTQTRLKPYLDAVTLTVDANGISLDFAAMNALLDSYRQSNAQDAFNTLVELHKYEGASLEPNGWGGVKKIIDWTR